jgi:protein-tyrosine-phosphatase
MNLLFLCKANVTRSQMAEAFFNSYSERHISESAGLKLDIDYIDERVIRAMGEIGFDLSDKRPKKVTAEMVNNADRVIIVSPDLKQYYTWDKKPIIWDIYDVIRDGNGKIPYQQFIAIRERVKTKIEELVREIG